MNDWSLIGGKSGKINVYARDEKSGTWDTFKGIVLGKSALISSAKRYEDSTALSNDVAGDINGIGFIGLPYVINAKAIAVSDGAEPIVPDRFTIATEDYPLSRRLFFYVPDNSTNAYAKSFVEFALSEEGQVLVAETGFVDLNIRLTRPDKSHEFSAQYRKMTEKADRLPVNFRFRKNSYEPDNKALRNLSRIVKYLKGQPQGDVRSCCSVLLTQSARHLKISGCPKNALLLSGKSLLQEASISLCPKLLDLAC